MFPDPRGAGASDGGEASDVESLTIASGEEDAALTYAKRLYENLVTWYKTAETKAQIILSLDGIFISFIVGSLFIKSGDARNIFGLFGPETWVFITLMSLSLVASIGSAIVSLLSRIMSKKELRGRYHEYFDNSKDLSHPARARDADYPSAVMWFFQGISELDAGGYREYLKRMTGPREREALGHQIHLLSGKVYRKLLWGNYGFGFAGLTFILFLLAGASYVLRVI